MRALPVRRMLACHHEAGHALAPWYFGYCTDFAQVQTIAEWMDRQPIEDQRGRICYAEGLVAGHDIAFFGDRRVYDGTAHNAMVRSNGRVRARIALVVAMAGPVAEIVYTKQSAVGCLLTDGQGDAAHADDVIKRWLCDESGHHIDEAWRMAAALVRSTLGRRSCADIARRLYFTGRIESDAIDEMLASIFGAKPRYDAWLYSWPPRLQQLRSGYIA